MIRFARTKSRIVSVTAGAACLLASAGTAWATDYDILTTNMALDPSDHLCGFSEAVEAVNSQGPFNECAAPSGNDRILLKAGTYQTFAQVVVGRSVQIVGAGTALTNFNTGGVLGLRIESQETGTDIAVKVSGLTIRNIQPSLPVTCVWASGNNGLVGLELEKVRVTDCSSGGIYLELGAHATIRNSAIENNRNTGIWIYAADMFMHSSLVANNSSSGGAGGIHFEGAGNSNIYNSTITGNSGLQGGGLYYTNINAGYLNLHNTTVAFNTATDRGGGLFGLTGGTPLTIFDSIVAQNTAPTHPDISGTVNSNRSLNGNTTGNAGTHTDEAGLLNVDPLLAPLMDMGGPTRVLPLRKGSPAIDARSPAAALDGNIDQRGFPRPVNTNEDLGAYEQGPLETELLAMEQKTAGVTHTTTTGSYSNGVATWLKGTASNQFVTYRVPVVQTGNHNLRVRVRKANSHGIWQLAVAPTLGGTYTDIGGPQDHYNASGTTVEIDLGTINFTSAGQKFFRFRATGKHALSSGYNLIVDYVKLTKL